MNKTTGANIAIFKLSDIKECVSIHPLYNHFGIAAPSLPLLLPRTLSACCTRELIPLLLVSKKKLIVVGNLYCYFHARQALKDGNRDIAVIVHQLSNLSDEDIFFRVLLDCLNPCPFLTANTEYRGSIVERALEKPDLLRHRFSKINSSTICKLLDISPSTLSHRKKMSEKERDRLARGEYHGRGKSATRVPSNPDLSGFKTSELEEPSLPVNDGVATPAKTPQGSPISCEPEIPQGNADNCDSETPKGSSVNCDIQQVNIETPMTQSMLF